MLWIVVLIVIVVSQGLNLLAAKHAVEQPGRLGRPSLFDPSAFTAQGQRYRIAAVWALVLGILVVIGTLGWSVSR